MPLVRDLLDDFTSSEVNESWASQIELLADFTDAYNVQHGKLGEYDTLDMPGQAQQPWGLRDRQTTAHCLALCWIFHAAAAGIILAKANLWLKIRQMSPSSDSVRTFRDRVAVLPLTKACIVMTAFKTCIRKLEKTVFCFSHKLDMVKGGDNQDAASWQNDGLEGLGLLAWVCRTSCGGVCAFDEGWGALSETQRSSAAGLWASF